MTEEQKYQGALYKNKKAKTAPSENTSTDKMAQAAYVEDVNDDWRDYEQRSDDDGHSAASPPPEAPTPPAADINVFDFLVANPTPTASSLSLPATNPVQLNEETQLVRFDYEANGMLDGIDLNDSAMVQYGSGPVPASFRTPGAKSERKKSRGESEMKSDKKRKRLHIETDQVMTDAPPILHSGLTGGLNRMMSRPGAFPPSPDYSGGDVPETPASPLKKSKSKHHKSRTEGLGNSLIAMIAAGSGVKPVKSKSSKKRKSSSTSTSTKKKSTKRLEAPKEQKLLEYRPGSKDSKEGDSASAGGQMVLFKPRAEHFLSFVQKGPESERGCSINKALKRYHRERSESGESLSKLMEEKELWRSLRMKKNEHGEIVLFCI
ncbi:hypothetical protein OQA88_3599 [Cercophora sp. LCS_1]